MCVLRYRVHQLVSTVSCIRLVSRSICWAPVAVLLGSVRNCVEVDWVGAARFQVGVDEREVRELVLGVVMDVLGHVRVEYGQRLA